MGFPVVTVAGNGFLSAGVRFQIKGVVYTGDSSGHTAIDVLADSNAAQCAIDAPMLKALGANTVSVHYIDASQGHGKCMQTLADNGIYVIANMATQRDYAVMNMTGMDTSSNIGNSTWEMGVFQSYASVLDSMAGYDNLLGLVIGSEIIYENSQVDLAPYLKAATRDMKAYAAAREYRTIPIGYFSNVDDAWYQKLGEYLVCGGNKSEAIDFYGVNAFQWCGDSSYTASGYDTILSDMEVLGVPVFFSEDGCNAVSPRTWQDQAAVFGSNMSSVWSGAIAYEWREQELSPNYGLASYTTAGVSTPTPLSDYSYLSSQWATASTNTDAPSTSPTPSCPASTGSYWPVDPSAAIPTIAGLDFATVRAADASTTPTSTSASGASSTTTVTDSSQGLSSGAKAGIGVGVAMGVILVIGMLVWFFFMRRRRNKGEENAPLPSAEVSDLSEMPATENWHQSSGPSEMSAPLSEPSELAGREARHELDSVAVHEADKGVSSPINGNGATRNPFEER